jgi:hypothetical protein
VTNLVDCELLVSGLILLLIELVVALLLVFSEAFYHILWKDETTNSVSKLNHSCVLLRLGLGLDDSHQLLVDKLLRELEDQVWEKTIFMFLILVL